MTRRRHLYARAGLVTAAVLVGLGTRGAVPAHGQERQCTPVQIESGENDDDALTALVVVPAGPPVTLTGDLDANVDGTMCGIGVYVAPGAQAILVDADVHSAQAFGVYDNGGQVTLDRSSVRDIPGNGESCGGEDETDDCGGGGGGGGMGGGGDDRGYTGGRHGTGVLIVGSGARGTIVNSTVEDYGRRGISVSGPGAFARIVNDRIAAPAAPLSWLNGVWIANGARARVEDDTILDNVSPAGVGKSSSAIMVAGGPSHNGMPGFTTGVQIDGNALLDNDTGVLLSNPGLEGNVKVPPPVPTRNHVSGNLIRTTSPLAPNDAGVNDGGGRGDHITGNVIDGYGDRSIVVSPFCVDTVVAGNDIDE